MINFVNNLGHNTNDVIADGYFFNKIFIADGDNKMIIDLKTKYIKLHKDCNKKFFYMQKYNGIAGNKDWNGKSENINWKIYESNTFVWGQLLGCIIRIETYTNLTMPDDMFLDSKETINSAVKLAFKNRLKL